MTAVLSPAKNMRPFTLQGLPLTQPQMVGKARQLVKILKGFSPWELETLLRVNPELAMKAFAAYQHFETGGGDAALLAFSGLAFSRLAAQDFTLADFQSAADRVCILSALYGLLRPADAIQPYRLEMQSRLRVDGENLYGFWKDDVYRALLRTEGWVVNLCSAEYARMFEPYLGSRDPFITCRFLSVKRGRLCMPATAAKMARGLMARFIIKNRLDTPRQLCGFEEDGYAFSQDHSSKTEYVFIKER